MEVTANIKYLLSQIGAVDQLLFDKHAWVQIMVVFSKRGARKEIYSHNKNRLLYVV